MPLPLLRKRVTLHNKTNRQTAVYNPFNLEQSRIGVWVKERKEHIQSIAGRRSIVHLVLFSASRFLVVPSWPLRPKQKPLPRLREKPERCYGFMRAWLVSSRQTKNKGLRVVLDLIFFFILLDQDVYLLKKISLLFSVFNSFRRATDVGRSCLVCCYWSGLERLDAERA